MKASERPAKSGTLCLAAGLAFLFLSLGARRTVGGESVLTPAMVGQWTGNARIIVRWCQQTNLSVAVEIRSDGTVTGTVGDATLTKGSLKRNRSWLGRELNLKTDYIIVGRLHGAIVATEGITRSSVSIPLNFKANTFAGGVHTSGSLFGGKKRMILSARSLTLTRTNDL